MGLNSGYEIVKTNVLSMEPLPPINKVLSLLHKIERQKQISDAVDVLSEANAYAGVRYSDSGAAHGKKHKLDSGQSSKGHLECSYCHHIGHSRSECFKLNECTFCGKKGHARNNYFKLNRSSFTGGKTRGPQNANRSGGYKLKQEHIQQMCCQKSSMMQLSLHWIMMQILPRLYLIRHN
ncbi:hypothetical protein RND81_06G124200 [Saponaria officinalis]|uniref:Gag-pol polyprotein n=1 Tax=Saponaria officinalis TaxID=3572 RepID=A0AAW1KCQ3_SAPOF